MLSNEEEGNGKLQINGFWFEPPELGTGNRTGACGTLAYAAPEILVGRAGNTGDSDLYSLGILTYQLLTRRLPFEDEDPEFLIQKHLQSSVDLRPIERMRGGSRRVSAGAEPARKGSRIKGPHPEKM